MSSEGWRQANRIFELLVERPPAEWAALLDRECGSDRPLRTAVERWLNADRAAEDFLETPLVHPATIPAAADDNPPTHVGPYRLLERIGQGGMGTVYLALRDDDTFRRQVAVKIISQSASSAAARQRFSSERRILATLEHPWIGRIYDGGETDDGTQYLVMEHIRGLPIDQFCDRRQVAFSDRLELLVKVCSAVHYSHQKLVVHRDLKPSNILVTEDSEPKLLDFGVAKLLQPLAGTAETAPTATWMRPLTPHYASPEQVRGEAVSTASDVYSLGVLLFKLLTGELPFGLAGKSLREIEEIVTDHDPPPPSSLATAGEVGRTAWRDLDCIVLKALRGEPAERYSSAERLGEDLRRFLDGFPVTARRGNFAYRSRKLLRRHRLAATFAALLAGLLTAYTVNVAVLAQRLERERAALEEVVDFFVDIFQSAGPMVAAGRAVTVRQAIDDSAERLANELTDQPQVRAEILGALADIYLDFGDAEPALLHSRQALELYRGLAGDHGDRVAAGLDRVGAALREVWQPEEAERLGQQALAWFRAHPDHNPRDLVRALNNLSTLYCYRGDYAGAAPYAHEALELARSQLGESVHETAVATVQQGQVLFNLGHRERAEQMYQRGLELYRLRFGEPHPLLATLHQNLARIHAERGDVERARESFRQADSQYLRIFGANYHERVKSLSALGRLASENAHPEEAAELFQQALEIGLANGSPPYILRPAIGLAATALESDSCANVIPWLRRGLAAFAADSATLAPVPEPPWQYFELQSLLGECLARDGSRREARELMRRSLARLEQLRPADLPLLARARQRLAMTQPDEGI